MARPQPVKQPAKLPPTVIVAATPGIQRDALVSILRAQPHLAAVAVAGDTATLRRLLEGGTPAGRREEGEPPGERPPLVAVVDTGLCGGALPALIRTLHQDFPAVRCVALADTAAQCAACTAAGAHAALLKGCLGEHLLDAIGG